jgi:hypothetical protein
MRKSASAPKSRVRINAKQILQSLKHKALWIENFQNALVSAGTTKAFETIVGYGCPAEDLLSLLDLSCGGTVESAMAEKIELSEDVESLVRQMLKTAKKIEVLERRLVRKPGLKSLDHPGFHSISTSLQSYSKTLEQDAYELKGKYSVRDMPQMAIAWLVAQVAGSTGKPHYSEVASLMGAYYKARGIQKPVTPTSIEKKTMRFRKKHRLAYTHIKNMASRQFGKLQDQYIPWSNNVTLKK